MPCRAGQGSYPGSSHGDCAPLGNPACGSGLGQNLAADHIGRADFPFIVADIFRNLQKALAIYGTTQVGGEPPIKDKDELVRLLNAAMRQTSEKGIDAAIITDLLSMAFDDNYDIAVLVSGDADYAPAVEYIQKKTDKQIVQAFFKAHGDQLRTACWSHIFFEDLFSKLTLAQVQQGAQLSPKQPKP